MECEINLDCTEKNTIIPKNLLKNMDESDILRELWHDSVKREVAADCEEQDGRFSVERMSS